MEEVGEDLQPFWLQSTTNLRRVDRYRHRLSSLFFNSAVLLIFLLATALLFLVFVIPSTISFSAQFFRLNSVKKSWDSLNLVLVLFALLFGFLSRNRNDDSHDYDQYHRQTTSDITVQKSNPSTPSRWYYSTGYADPRAFDYNYSNYNGDVRSVNRMGSLRRNSSSYPDLRQVSSPSVAGDDQWRFYDDTQVHSYRISDSDYHRVYRRWPSKKVDREDVEIKDIHADTFPSSRAEGVSFAPPPSPPPPPPSPPPPPPPPPPQRAVREKEKRTYQRIGYEEKRNKNVSNDSETTDILTPPSAPPPLQHREQKYRVSEKKRDGGNATKEFLASLYQKKKKKKRQRQRSVDNLDTFFNQSQPPSINVPTPPPPPSSVFHNLFTSKKGKRRRIPSDPPQAPPPPPPPPPVMVARSYKPRTQIQPATTYKPPLPVKINSFSSVEENSSSGGESPLVRIPPPPPPPPFKMPAWKFVVQGDYVRIESISSSRSGSPDLDDVETSPSAEAAAASSSSLFCPSPDVNTKADNFIEKFKAGLMLEKINSFNQKQTPRMSNLGPGNAQTQI